METFESPRRLTIPNGAAVIRGQGEEPRHSPQYGGQPLLVEVQQQDTDAFTYRTPQTLASVRLRSSTNLAQFIDGLTPEIYIDITALSHHVWAPILRAALNRNISIRVIYVEPDQYIQSLNGLEGEIFDLSERITGVAAIPGFASFGDEFDDHSCFIPMLGFEGRRTSHIMENVQPRGNAVYPVVGLPGFRPEFPFHTFHSNARFLHETQAWKNVVYAAANNPFSAYDALLYISELHQTSLMKIAPIGTKPHALGAFLFPLKTLRRVEFIYDFPIRRTNRTSGVGKTFVYDVSGFMATS